MKNKMIMLFLVLACFGVHASQAATKLNWQNMEADDPRWQDPAAQEIITAHKRNCVLKKGESIVQHFSAVEQLISEKDTLQFIGIKSSIRSSWYSGRTVATIVTRQNLSTVEGACTIGLDLAVHFTQYDYSRTAKNVATVGIIAGMLWHGWKLLKQRGVFA